jgi:hypothetical protein
VLAPVSEGNPRPHYERRHRPGDTHFTRAGRCHDSAPMWTANLATSAPSTSGRDAGRQQRVL